MKCLRTFVPLLVLVMQISPALAADQLAALGGQWKGTG